MNSLGIAYFYFCALLALGGAIAVVASKNPIRGAMGLLVLIVSIAGLFLALHAQFLAAIQLIVYAGAIVVLFLFVIMLLGPNAASPHDHRGLYVRAFSGTLYGLAGVGGIAAVVRSTNLGLPMHAVDPQFGGIDAFGGVLFTDALAPFELSSALLMVAVVGAIAVARGRQGVRSLTRGEAAIAHAPAGGQLPAGHSGVFSHEIHASEAKEGGAMIPVEHYIILSSLLFVTGGVGFLIRRNVLVTLMSIEVMLNAANLALVAFNRVYVTRGATQTYAGDSHTGQVFAFFIIAAEAAEVAVGLAIVLSLYRLRRTVRTDEADLLKN